MDSATLELLWARFLDGDELDPAEEALLADALEDDPNLRDRFLRDHEIETALQWLPRTHLGEAAFVTNVLQQWSNVQAAPSRAEQILPGPRSAKTGRWLMRWSPTAVAAALLIGAIGWVWNSGRRDAVAPLATLVLGEQAKWDGEQPKAQLTADPMRLSSGTAQMLLVGGAHVTARGPAEWRILSGDRLLAQRGKFSSVVPRRAIGFTIQTPTAVVVDLGTEFDVEVDPDGATSVAVERGAVELATIPLAGAPSTRWRLTAGERRRVDRHGNAVDAPEPSEQRPKFRGALAVDGQVREFDDEAAYQKALTDARKAPAKKPPDVQVAASDPTPPLRGLDRVAKEVEERAAKAPPAPVDDPVPPSKEKTGLFICNGRTIEFSNLEEFEDSYLGVTGDSDNVNKQLEEMQKRMQREFERNMGVAFPNGFRQFGLVNNLLTGSISWDDRRWEFNDRQSLDRARLQLRRHLNSTKANPKAKATPEPVKSKPKAKANPNPKTKPAADKPGGKPAASKNWKDIEWHTRIADACKEAAGAPGPEDDKPVFVFRVLGDLNGFM